MSSVSLVLWMVGNLIRYSLYFCWMVAVSLREVGTGSFWSLLKKYLRRLSFLMGLWLFMFGWLWLEVFIVIYLDRLEDYIIVFSNNTSLNYLTPKSHVLILQDFYFKLLILLQLIHHNAILWSLSLQFYSTDFSFIIYSDLFLLNLSLFT